MSKRKTFKYSDMLLPSSSTSKKNPVFLSGFLPLAFSKQCHWFWVSLVRVHCIPVTCTQLESSCPQTGTHSSDTARAESHNPALRTSLHAGWCQCLVPCPADGPFDLLWKSSSPYKCIKTPWMVISLFVSWVRLTCALIFHQLIIIQTCLCPSLLYRCHRWGQDRVGSQIGRGPHLLCPTSW